jgi:hypothetical protein
MATYAALKGRSSTVAHTFVTLICNARVARDPEVVCNG